MTYVQRLPQLQLPTVELSGRTFALLLVAAFHLIVIALVIEVIDKTRPPFSTAPPDIELLPPTVDAHPPPNPLDDVAPLLERAIVVAQQPVIEIARPNLPPEVPADSGAIETGPVVDTGRPLVVRSQPRQDPAHPLGRPVYPAQSIRLDEAGVVVVNFCVEASGRLTDVTLGASSGYRRLDQAALDHLRKPSTRLLPGMENGVPVRTCTDLNFRFGFDID